ncbi:MAG: 16S rRNA (adenine(1518)-N(6)/adenine(1519)-N(6))-dimethyltransferase, partial [Clostridia bacterium]|nr:16S rRNA (adenine(1518)-N(6)/adenine(1519)-N(6))-dimethyltransferase [Clostridia bacterium]
MTEYMNPSPELRARVALEKYGFHNTHSLGQNFLLDGGLLERLLDLAGVRDQDNVLEIGPGAGVMTALLSLRCRRVLAVEVDRGLEPVLGDVLAGRENARVVFADAMKADVAALTGEAFGGEPWRVVANLPYYITADIVLRLVTAKRPPESVAVMV